MLAYCDTNWLATNHPKLLSALQAWNQAEGGTSEKIILWGKVENILTETLCKPKVEKPTIVLPPMTEFPDCQLCMHRRLDAFNLTCAGCARRKDKL